MGKRVIRVDRHQLKKVAPSLIGKEVNIVLQSDHTQYGNLIETKDDVFTLKDFRDHLHIVPVTSIVEIIYDEVRAW
jgi:hypothetical protein